MSSAKSLIVRIAILLLGVAVTFLFAQHTLAARYKPYDDEGYFLLPSARPYRNAACAAGGVGAAAVAIAGWSLSQGMSLATLLDGVVFAPLRQPKVFSIPLEIPVPAVLAWLAVAGAVLWLWKTHSSGQSVPDWLQAVRAGAGLLATVLLSTFFHKNWLVLPFLPLVCIPSQGWRWPDFFRDCS